MEDPSTRGPVRSSRLPITTRVRPRQIVPARRRVCEVRRIGTNCTGSKHQSIQRSRSRSRLGRAGQTRWWNISSTATRCRRPARAPPGIAPTNTRRCESRVLGRRRRRRGRRMDGGNHVPQLFRGRHRHFRFPTNALPRTNLCLAAAQSSRDTRAVHLDRRPVW